MTIRLSPQDRFGPVRPQRRGGKAVALLVYGLVLPVTLLALGLAGFYIVTGDTPMDVMEELAGEASIDMAMPPRPGPEHPEGSLMQPPGTAADHANDSDVKMEKAEEPKPEAKSEEAKPEETKPAEPKAEETAHAEPPPQAGASGGPQLEAPPSAPPIQEPLVPPGGDPLAAPAFAKLPTRTDLKPLAPAPLPELLKTSQNGPLPIAAAGKESRSAYARPFTADAAMPRIAVVVVGLGLSKEATESAILKLPPDVTLSFSPYAANLDGWIKRARATGHEVMLDLPLEPPNFPTKDSGSLSILSNQTPLDVVSHLEGVLTKGTSYVGLAGTLRSPVTGSPQWPTLLRSIRSRGLIYLGDGLAGVSQNDAPASATVTLVPDEAPFRAAIDVRLARLMSAAQRDQTAVAYVSPRPVTLERLLAWFDTFPQRGVTLAPVSAVAKLPGGGQTDGGSHASLPPSSLETHEAAPAAHGAPSNGAKHE
ncbi:MAG TPA: divergent polysaccharide deacetylase family protein [Candidatus Sulfotelmatobacter sp.]|nr:divergent polysaccharide deacetylase family protein [Candidatus Sulfotelmatobacter sp.]